MSVSFEGIETAVVTFRESNVTAGYPVAVCASGTVGNAASGVAPAGIALNVRSGCAAVQVKGFVTLSYSGTTAPALGWASIKADGTGGVCAADGGRMVLVVEKDETEKTVGLFL